MAISSAYSLSTRHDVERAIEGLVPSTLDKSQASEVDLSYLPIARRTRCMLMCSRAVLATLLPYRELERFHLVITVCIDQCVWVERVDRSGWIHVFQLIVWTCQDIARLLDVGDDDGHGLVLRIRLLRKSRAFDRVFPTIDDLTTVSSIQRSQRS